MQTCAENYHQLSGNVAMFAHGEMQQDSVQVNEHSSMTCRIIGTLLSSAVATWHLAVTWKTTSFVHAMLT